MNFKKLTKGLLLLATVAGLSHSALAEDTNKISYKFGKGLSIETSGADGDFKLNISGFVQPRFTYTKFETRPDSDSFSIQRGKVILGGYVFNKTFNYGFAMNFATRAVGSNAPAPFSTKPINRTNSTSGNGVLDDYFIDWVPRAEVGIKVGQFKVPYKMQELTGDTNLEFVDRSLDNGIFTFARDIGLNVHGNLFEDQAFGYNVFVFNGDGQNNVNSNQGLMLGTRLTYNILGKYETNEPDIEGSKNPSLGVGVAYVFADGMNGSKQMSQAGTIAVGTPASNGTFDIGYHYNGWTALGSIELTRTHQPEGAHLTNWGYNAQVGYMLWPKHFELALKNSGAIFSDAAPNQFEYGVGGTYFVKGNAIKLATDYSLLMNVRGFNYNDHRIRTQLQLMF